MIARQRAIPQNAQKCTTVKIFDALSSVIAVSSGVPQGSVLGLILFLLYVNDTVDIFSGLSVSCKLCADDVKLYSSYSVSMTNQDLNVAIDSLLLWSSQWQLKIANEKCLVLRISNHRRISTCLHPTYTINGHLLNTVSEVRDLGVIVDSSLEFDKHISSIVRKAQQRAGLILKCFCSRDKDLLMKAFLYICQTITGILHTR